MVWLPPRRPPDLNKPKSSQLPGKALPWCRLSADAPPTGPSPFAPTDTAPLDAVAISTLYWIAPAPSERTFPFARWADPSVPACSTSHLGRLRSAGCGGREVLDYLTITSAEEGGPNDHYRTALNISKRGMPRPDVESEVVKLLSYRYELAERVYFHHAKNAASVMIGRAVQEAGLATGTNSPAELDKNFHWLSDGMLLKALSDEAIHAALKLTRAPGDHDLAKAANLAQGVNG